VAAFCGALIGFCPAALGYSYGTLVTPQGPEELVFDAPGPCPSPPGVDPPVVHSVDGPARAFRDGSGRVQLLLPHGRVNRRLVGPSLGALSIDCTVVHLANGRWTPASTYANGSWLTAAYRLGGGTVRALVHNEYHGLITTPPDCSAGMGDQDCWMSSVTSALSTDDGDSYTYQPAAPGHLAAALPYRYEPDWGAQGFQNPSNIILSPADGLFYSMFNVRSNPQTAPGRFRDQEIGECVMRSATLEPQSWRAWNGASFDVQFRNPYDPGFDPVADPPDHVCTPVSTSNRKLGRSFTAHALTYSSFFNKHMAIGQLTRDGVRGFFYSLSDDMVDWSSPRLIRTTVVPGDCSTPERTDVYPSILDAADQTANFERPGQHAYLYYLRLMSCPTASSDRDMFRVPVKFARPLRWSTGAAERCPGGFDEHVTSPSATIAPDQATSYSGAPFAYRSDTGLGGGSAYGLFDREDYPADCAESDPTVRPTFKYSAGNDIWYSAAFLLPADGFWNRARGDVTIMRLDNRPAADDTAGAVSVGADNRLHFTTDPSDSPGDEAEILSSGAGDGVPLPNDGCWHFVEVHQRFGDTGAVNQLWLDGVPQDTVSGTDNFHGAPYDRLGAGIVSTGAGGSGALTVFTDMVGYGYGGPLSYIRCNGTGPSSPAALGATAPQQAALQVLAQAPAAADPEQSRPGPQVRFRAREPRRTASPRGRRGRADRGAAAQARPAARGAH
jgi:hypothetical protein